MESATVMKTFHGNLTPKSLTLRDRDASFSSYLQPHHHHTIGSARCRGLDDSTSELSIFDAHKYFNEVTNNNDSIQKVTTISSNSRVSPLVNNNTNNMDTERIIPEKGNTTTETTRYSSASSSVDGYANKIRNYRASSFHAATPTASSEASWNSQAGLLSHPPAGAIPVSMMRNPPNPTDLNKKLRASLYKPIWLLRRKCPCSGKKSVEVKEKKIPEPKTKIPPPPSPPPKPQPPLRDHHSINLKRQDHENMNTTETLKNIIPITHNNRVVDKTATFVATTKSQRFHSQQVVTSSSMRVPFTEGFTFPVLNPHSSTSTTKLQVLNGVVGEEEEEEEDPARDSLEVFQPPNNDAVELPTSVSPKTRVNVIVDDDAASDASSDLFEIESFSTTATQSTSTYPMTTCRRRDSIDEASSNSNNNNNGFFFGRGSMDEVSTTPPITECYEPSEASIEWSVTTAEGFYDRASVAAEDESSSAVQGHGGGGGPAEKWKRKGGNGLLVGCRCEKAVSVGPQPVKSEGQRGTTFYSRHVSVSSSSSNSRTGSSVNKPPLARSHNTARVSLAFAT